MMMDCRDSGPSAISGCLLGVSPFLDEDAREGYLLSSSSATSEIGLALNDPMIEAMLMRREASLGELGEFYD